VSSGPEVLRCSEAAEARGDQLGATAPPAQRLVLVEQAGPWGRDAVRESELAKAVATDLLRRAMEVNARVLLIRRPGRPWPSDGTRQWAVVDTRPGAEATWWGSFADERELLDVPLDGTGGERSDALTYLVCTHGRHDVCCAIRGRPVAAAFAACRPQQTWECSHVGGDRFAANVVVAPYGLYYGHVPPAEVLGLVRANESGVVTPTLLRGRTAFSSPVQAAMHHARAALGELRINGIDLVAEAPATQGTHRHRDSWHVRLGHDSGLIDVVVRASSKAVDGRLTCAAVDQGHIRSFDLVSLTLPPAATAPRGQN
jgi:hypothetical protein